MAGPWRRSGWQRRNADSGCFGNILKYVSIVLIMSRSWTGIDRFRVKFVHLLWKFDELINRKFVEYICWTKGVVWISVWRWKFVYNEFVCSRNNSYLVDEDDKFFGLKSIKDKFKTFDESLRNDVLLFCWIKVKILIRMILI